MTRSGHGRDRELSPSGAAEDAAPAAPDSSCRHCGGTGWVAADDDPTGPVRRCTCFRRSQVERRLAAAGIPERYRHCTLDNFDILPKMHETIEGAKLVAERFIDKYPDVPYGLLFTGDPGVGKTHLAVAVLRALIEGKGIVGTFADYRDLLRSIQDSYNPVAQASELKILRPIINAEVLLLDELGARRPSSWVLDTVTHILNDRYAHDRITLVTTNYSIEADDALRESLANRIGGYAVSRLHEMCQIRHMVGEDFRKRHRSASHTSDRYLSD